MYISTTYGGLKDKGTSRIQGVVGRCISLSGMADLRTGEWVEMSEFIGRSVPLSRGGLEDKGRSVWASKVVGRCASFYHGGLEAQGRSRMSSQGTGRLVSLTLMADWQWKTLNGWGQVWKPRNKTGKLSSSWWLKLSETPDHCEW